MPGLKGATVTSKATESMLQEGDFERWLDQAHSGDVQAQMMVGKHYRGAQEYGRARRWLGKASRNGNSHADFILGSMLVGGEGRAASLAEGKLLIQRAAENNNAEALNWLATFHYREGLKGATEGFQSSWDYLTKAARHNSKVAAVTMAFLHKQAGDQESAFAWFFHAANLESSFASFVVGLRYLRGSGTSQDTKLGSQWMQAAERLGSYCASQFEQSDADTEVVGTAGDPPEIRLDAYPALTGLQQERLGASVSVLPDALDQEDCAYLIELAAPYMMPSYTVHPVSGEPVRDQTRTSWSWSLHVTQEDIVVLRLKEILMGATDKGVGFAEPLSILRYRMGQEYKAHYDWINPAVEESRQSLSKSGQRITTVFAYLMAPEAGGETAFPKLDLKIKPETGLGVMFSNVDAQGEPDKQTLHASLPVETGEKWLATLWVREKEVDLNAY